MKNDVYHECPIYKKRIISLRKTASEDTRALLKCYSDEKSVPFFNSDNCNGDDFYYTSLERMQKAIDFWEHSYKTRQFVRWTVLDNKAGEGIGTIEMFNRTNAALGRFGILRIDLRSDFETHPIITEIVDIASQYFYEVFDVDAILTKAVPAAAARIDVLLNSGYKPLEGDLVKYGHYFVRKFT